jgi:uncharacterized protein involved in exopolysaccharide biosynthesis
MKDSQERSVHLDSGEDIDILELLIVLAKRKGLVLGLPVTAAILAAIVSLLMPNVYTSSAQILPPQQSQSAATVAMLGQLGGLGNVAAGAFGLKNPSDLYVGILRSRSIADDLIERFKLKQVFNVETIDDARLELENITRITSGKDGIILIEVEDSDPARAAELANAYVQELEKKNERLAITEAAQRRLFFEKQLSAQQTALAAAEVELKNTQERTGLIKLDEQGKAIIEAVAQLRAQIAVKEVQIGAMSSFTTSRNPERIRIEAELSGLRKQLSKLETNRGARDDNTLVPMGEVPELGLEYVRKLRDVKYNETLLELLAKQYALARLDESRDVSLIQVLDRAVPPERRSKPKRTLIVLVTAFIAGALGLLLAFLQESIARSQLSPERAQRLAILFSHLRTPLRRS